MKIYVKRSTYNKIMRVADAADRATAAAVNAGKDVFEVVYNFAVWYVLAFTVYGIGVFVFGFNPFAGV